MKSRKRPITDMIAEHLGRPLIPSERAVLELSEVILDSEKEEEPVEKKKASAGV